MWQRLTLHQLGLLREFLRSSQWLRRVSKPFTVLFVSRTSIFVELGDYLETAQRGGAIITMSEHFGLRGFHQILSRSLPIFNNKLLSRRPPGESRNARAIAHDAAVFATPRR